MLGVCAWLGSLISTALAPENHFHKPLFSFLEMGNAWRIFSGIDPKTGGKSLGSEHQGANQRRALVLETLNPGLHT